MSCGFLCLKKKELETVCIVLYPKTKVMCLFLFCVSMDKQLKKGNSLKTL